MRGFTGLVGFFFFNFNAFSETNQIGIFSSITCAKNFSSVRLVVQEKIDKQTDRWTDGPSDSIQAFFSEKKC